MCRHILLSLLLLSATPHLINAAVYQEKRGPSVLLLTHGINNDLTKALITFLKRINPHVAIEQQQVDPNIRIGKADLVLVAQFVPGARFAVEALSVALPQELFTITKKALVLIRYGSPEPLDLGALRNSGFDHIFELNYGGEGAGIAAGEQSLKFSQWLMAMTSKQTPSKIAAPAHQPVKVVAKPISKGTKQPADVTDYILRKLKEHEEKLNRILAILEP
jgi:hypothetical protein